MSPTRTINVVTCEPFKSGSTNGRDWTIYEVVATDTNGEPIDKTLKSFERLEGTVEVEVTRNDNPKYDEYLLRRAGAKRGGGNGGGLGKSIDELRARVDGLEQRLLRIEQARQPVATSSPPQVDPDDIPF